MNLMKTLSSKILPRIPEINIYELLVYLRHWEFIGEKNYGHHPQKTPSITHLMLICGHH